MSVQNEKKAIELRREGKSYSDIAKLLKVSRASVCGWVKNIRLTDQEKHLLQKNIEAKKGRARMQALMTIRTRKVYKEKVAYDFAEKEFEKYRKDPFFMYGLALTDPSRSKSGYKVFQFSTSDPQNIKILLKWLSKYAGVSSRQLSYRLSTASSHKNHNLEEFWVKTLGITKENLLKTLILPQKKDEKDREYKGSFTLFLGKIEVVRRLIAWQKLTMLYYS